MVDIDYLGQLIDSMSEAVEQLQKATTKNKTEDANKLRVFIHDLHRQIEQLLTKKRGGEYMNN